jgi:hypothetical protein
MGKGALDLGPRTAVFSLPILHTVSSSSGVHSLSLGDLVAEAFCGPHTGLSPADMHASMGTWIKPNQYNFTSTGQLIFNLPNGEMQRAEKWVINKIYRAISSNSRSLLLSTSRPLSSCCRCPPAESPRWMDQYHCAYELFLQLKL